MFDPNRYNKLPDNIFRRRRPGPYRHWTCGIIREVRDRHYFGAYRERRKVQVIISFHLPSLPSTFPVRVRLSSEINVCGKTNVEYVSLWQPRPQASQIFQVSVFRPDYTMCRPAEDDGRQSNSDLPPRSVPALSGCLDIGLHHQKLPASFPFQVHVSAEHL